MDWVSSNLLNAYTCLSFTPGLTHQHIGGVKNIGTNGTMSVAKSKCATRLISEN